MESYCTTKRTIESYLRVLIMCLDLRSGSWPLSREPKLIEKGWALQASTVIKSLNFVTINAQRIDLGIKIWRLNPVSPMHCLASLKTLAEL